MQPDWMTMVVNRCHVISHAMRMRSASSSGGHTETAARLPFCVTMRHLPSLRLSVSMVDDGGGADDVDMMPLGRRLERLASNRSHAVSEVASAAAGPAEPAHNAQRISRAGTPTGAIHHIRV